MIQDATMNKIQEKQEEKKVPAWAKELKSWSVGKYYFSGVVDDLDSLLELYRRDTLCTFGTRTFYRDGLWDDDDENLVINDSEDNLQVR